MLAILEFIFKDFWHWFGTVILLAVITDAIVEIIHGTGKVKEDSNDAVS